MTDRMLREDVAKLISDTRTADSQRSLKAELELAADIITLVREDTLRKVQLYARREVG